METKPGMKRYPIEIVRHSVDRVDPTDGTVISYNDYTDFLTLARRIRAWDEIEKKIEISCDTCGSFPLNFNELVIVVNKLIDYLSGADLRGSFSESLADTLETLSDDLSLVYENQEEVAIIFDPECACYPYLVGEPLKKEPEERLRDTMTLSEVSSPPQSNHMVESPFNKEHRDRLGESKENGVERIHIYESERLSEQREKSQEPEMNLGVIADKLFDESPRNRPLQRWVGAFLVGLPLLYLFSGLSSLRPGGLTGWFFEVFNIVLVVMLIAGILLLVLGLSKKR